MMVASFLVYRCPGKAWNILIKKLLVVYLSQIISTSVFEHRLELEITEL